MKKLRKALFALFLLSLTTIAIATTKHLSSVKPHGSQKSYILCESKDVISPYFPVHSFLIYSVGWASDGTELTFSFYDGDESPSDLADAPVNVIVTATANTTNITDTIKRFHSTSSVPFDYVNPNVVLTSVTPNEIDGKSVIMAQ